MTSICRLRSHTHAHSHNKSKDYIITALSWHYKFGALYEVVLRTLAEPVVPFVVFERSTATASLHCCLGLKCQSKYTTYNFPERFVLFKIIHL